MNGSHRFLLAALLALGANACTRTEPPGREILFQAQRPGDTEDIYTMQFATGTIHRLTHAERAYANSYAVWDPPGSRIAFIREFDTHNELFILDSVGAEPRRLPTPGLPIISLPRWSPDGEALLIPAGSDWEHMSLYRIRADGRDLSRIPVEEGNYLCGSWAPDGRRVVASRAAATAAAIVEIEVSSGRLQVLFSSDSTELECPDWSPDGQSILLTVRHGTRAEVETADRVFADLAVFDLASGKLRALTSGPGVNNHGRWDATGLWIIFQCTPNPVGRDTVARRRFFTSLEICVIRPDGTQRRALTHNQYFDAHPSW